MTEVSFHFNVADRIAHACRLLRKAVRQEARVVVTGPPEVLADLDRALWTFDALDFVPHLRVPPGATIAPRLRATPIWLADRADVGAPDHPVLVNLGRDVAAGFESFARVIEIVPVDEDERVAARVRWKHYANRGYAIKRHEVGA